MKKLSNLILFISFIAMSSLSMAATLTSMNKEQIKQAFINKTSTSIATDNLNGRDINNTFSFYLDEKGNLFGKMAKKPADQPQTDKGVYTIKDDGTIYLTWQHWDGAKQLCFHIFNTQNAFITVDCNNVFHSAFMKAAIKPGNHLE